MQVTIGCLALLAVGSALEEHPHFCIDTEPLLLSEIDRHVVIPTERDLQCHIKATTLTLKEKVGSSNDPWFVTVLLFYIEPKTGSSLRDQSFLICRQFFVRGDLECRLLKWR